MSFFKNLNLVPTTLAFALVAAPALAQDTETTQTTETTDAMQDTLEMQQGPVFPKLDIGVASGFNNPSGIYGFETNYRFMDHVGVGLLGGNGAWGLRLTPQVRLYPFGVSNSGLFLEGGLSLNLGGESFIEVNGERQTVDQLFTPVVTTALGYRIPFVENKAWFLLRAGWGFRLAQDNIRVQGGGELNPLLGAALTLSQHEGFLFGAAIGIALF
jgi:hypothetical protein